MKKIFNVLLVVFLLFSCRTNFFPVNRYPDIDTQFNRNTLIQNLKNIDSFIYEENEIIIYNPYKYKGALQLKGSMHNHSNNSFDSFIDPFEAGERFRDIGGYDFYALTDHSFITYDPGVPGIVWMGNSLEDTKTSQHLNIFNLPDNYEYINLGNDFNTLVNYYRELGAVICYNHPDWQKRYQSNRTILDSPDVDFVEVINGEINSERAFDLLLSRGTHVFGMAVDDYHFYEQESLREEPINKAYIIAFADRKEKENIWQALLTGNFYMVYGNARIDIKCENGVIYVSSDLPSNFEFIGLNKAIPQNGSILYQISDVTEASYAINGTEGYVRVRVTNADGTAYSQAFIIY